MSVVDPFELARTRLVHDADATRGLPGLFEAKRAKLTSSARGLLRGSVELFYTLAAADPSLVPGPDERGFVVGDMHAENLGVYQGEAKQAVFDLDDFDDAGIAPLRYDVVRVATSFMLAALEIDPSVGSAIGVVDALVGAYVRGRVEPSGTRGKLPPRIAAMLRDDRDDLLQGRVEKRRGELGYVRGDRYADLPSALVDAAPRLLHLYIGALGERAPKHADELVLCDAAWRIAGNGSLGRRRIAYVLRRRARVHLVELKESRASALELVGAIDSRWPHHAARVVAAAHALPAVPARGLAAVHDEVDGTSYVGRWLTPQYERIDVPRDCGTRIAGYARVVGDRLAAAHARGLAAAEHADDAGAWTDPALRERLLDAAVRLAAVHRAVHLAYCRLAPAFTP